MQWELPQHRKTMSSVQILKWWTQIPTLKACQKERRTSFKQKWYLPWYQLLWACQVAQWYRIRLAMQETQVQSLGRKIPRRRAWRPTPVLLPGKSKGQRSLAGYSPQDCKESDTTEHTHISCLILHVIIYTHKHTHVLAFSLLHFFILNAMFPMK